MGILTSIFSRKKEETLDDLPPLDTEGEQEETELPSFSPRTRTSSFQERDPNLNPSFPQQGSSQNMDLILTKLDLINQRLEVLDRRIQVIEKIARDSQE